MLSLHIVPGDLCKDDQPWCTENLTEIPCTTTFKQMVMTICDLYSENSDHTFKIYPKVGGTTCWTANGVRWGDERTMADARLQDGDYLYFDLT